MLQSSLVHAVASRISPDYKSSVRWATTAALPANTAAGAGHGKTLTANANGVLPNQDGVATALVQRGLVKDEMVGADVDHGVYVVTDLGAADPGGRPWVLTRADDFDDAADVTDAAGIPVEQGTQAGQVWYLTTNDPIVLDTTALAFAMGPAGFVPLTRTLTAGAGLTGGGDLSADRTFDVVANADGSIVVNANDVQLGRIAGATAPAAGATAAIYGVVRLTANPAVADTPIAVGSNRVLTAGAGLTGGGDLTADRTFDVVANADGSIVVNANDVQLGRIAGATAPAAGATSAIYGVVRLTADPAVADTPIAVGANRTLTSGGGITGGGDLTADRTFAVGAGTGITVNADDVAVNQATAFAWTADHSWTSTTDVAATSRELKISHRRATPTDGDSCGVLGFYANDDNVGLNETRFAYLEGIALDVSDATEDGALDLYVTVAAAQTRVARLDGTGLGIGTTAPVGLLHGARSAANAMAFLDTFNAGGAATELYLRKSRNDTIGTLTTTIDTDTFGKIEFRGVDTGNNWDTGASIVAQQNGAAGVTLPTRLTLSTWSSTAQNVSQLVLNSDGNVGIGVVPTAGLHLSALSAAAGADSRTLRLAGNVVGPAARNLDLLGEFDAGTDTYRLRLNDNGGNPLCTMDAAGLTTHTLVSGGTVGPECQIYLAKTVAGAANDVAGLVSFYAEDAAGTKVPTGEMRSILEVATAGNASGSLVFRATDTSVLRNLAKLGIRGGAAAADMAAYWRNDVAATTLPAFTFYAGADFGWDEYAFSWYDNASVAAALRFGVTGQGSATAGSGGSTAATAFTVDGDPNTGIYFPAADQVGVSTGNVATALFQVDLATLYSASATGVGMELRLRQDSASPVATDVVGNLTYYGEDDASAAVQYGGIETEITVVAAATRSGRVTIKAAGNAVMRECARFQGSGAAAAVGFLGAAASLRKAHVVDPAGGATVDAESRTAINAILVTLEDFGFHATV